MKITTPVPAGKNWIITPDGDTLNLNYISRFQLDGDKIYIILGQNLGDGTSGSNAILAYTYADAPAAAAAYAFYQEKLKQLSLA